MKTILIVLATTLLFGQISYADQCAWNDKSAATVARGYLAYKTGPLYIYCEPCGDTEMQSVMYGHDYENTKDQRSIHFRKQTTTTAQPGDVVWQFIVNEGYPEVERKLDLAYVYEKTEDGFINLGAKFSCRDNKYWNPTKLNDYKAKIPVDVTPYIPTKDAPPIVEDVTELDFMKAHEKRYPNKPQG